MRYVVLIIIILIFLGMTVGTAEGGIIEFKKKYVTNSPEVCGDKLCDEDSKAYSSQEEKNQHTPLGQYKLGIPVYKITCKTHLSFVLKLSNWYPACVKPENVDKLISMGWAATLQEKNSAFSAMSQKEDPQFKPLEEYRKEYPLNEGLGMSITHNTIQGESYLLFEGYGWHVYHNVEITISNESEEIEFMMSQTDPRGNLYLPWKIPDTISSGMYQVYATDGIHEYEIDIPISAQE